MSRSLARVLLVAGIATFLPRSAGAVLLARSGHARATIVLAAHAIPAESTAASELALYLGKITGARFTVVTEGEAVPAGPKIFVGPTLLARRLGFAPERRDAEEWIVRASGNNVVLAGGRPRGTLYAVYHFLEDDLGVRWWNAFEESVPKQATLRLGEIAHDGKPAFAQRDLVGADGRAEFLVRHRVNGANARITWTFGGFEGCATPWFVHSFFKVVVPETYFASHPEYFSERAGARAEGETQLCLTNPDLPGIVAGALSSYATAADDGARATGIPPHRLLDFSQNDWGGRCTCAACAAAAAQAGSESGPLISFVNDVAARVGHDHPDFFLTTLAYTYTFDPPVGITASDGVIVRLSGYGKRDFGKGVAAPENERFRKAVVDWSHVASHLWIWDYAIVFTDDQRNLPMPSYRYYAEDFRFYRDHGVSGVLAQHDFPIAADLRDLKLWLYLELMENPDQDEDALIRDFTDGYYGDAGPAIRRYLDWLEARAGRNVGFIGADSNEDAFTYVDADFVVGAAAAFDAAEAAVKNDPLRARRVRHARLSADFALLRLGPGADLAGAARRLGVDAPDRAAVARRYRRTWYEQIDLRADPGEREALRSEIDAEMEGYSASSAGSVSSSAAPSPSIR